MTDRRDPALSLTGSHYPTRHRFLRRSPPTWPWVCSPSTVAPPIPTQTGGAPSRTLTWRRNPADITESLASPSRHSQRLQFALSNHRIHNRRALGVHEERGGSRGGGNKRRCFPSAVVGNLGVKYRPQGGLKGLHGGPQGPRIGPHFIAVTGQTRATVTFASGHNSQVSTVPQVQENAAGGGRFHGCGWTPGRLLFTGFILGFSLWDSRGDQNKAGLGSINVLVCGKIKPCCDFCLRLK